MELAQSYAKDLEYENKSIFILRFAQFPVTLHHHFIYT